MQSRANCVLRTLPAANIEVTRQRQVRIGVNNRAASISAAYASNIPLCRAAEGVLSVTSDFGTPGTKFLLRFSLLKFIGHLKGTTRATFAL